MPGIRTEDTPTAFAQALLEVACADGVAEQTAVPRSGPTASARHAYIPNQVELARALWWNALSEFDRRALESSHMEGDPVQAIKALGVAYARFAMEDPARYRELFCLDTGRLAADLNSNLSRESTYRLLLQWVTEAFEQRGLCLTDPELVAQTLWAGLHGIFSLISSWTDFPFRPTALLVSTMIDTLLVGVLANSTPASSEAGLDNHEVALRDDGVTGYHVRQRFG